MKKILLCLMFLLLLTGCSAPATPLTSQNGIEIYNARILAGTKGMVSGAFLTIKNTSDQADRLLGARCDVAQFTELHETRVKDNVVSMDQIDGVDIPAGAMLELRHGSYHLMLINLSRDLSAGETISLTLIFEKAGEVIVPIPVQE